MNFDRREAEILIKSMSVAQETIKAHEGLLRMIYKRLSILRKHDEHVALVLQEIESHFRRHNLTI